MPKRKSTLPAELGFQVLRANNGVPDTYKCLCGAMKQFVAYRAALRHSYRCESCLMTILFSNMRALIRMVKAHLSCRRRFCAALRG
jgi:hypothetical protein